MLSDGVSSKKRVERVDAEIQLCLIVRRVCFGGVGEAFDECEKLVESTRPRENKWGGVQNDVVTHAVRVGVRNETVVRPIVMKCRSEIKSNEAEVVPRFAPGIVEDDESPARCNWVGEKVVGLAINSVVGRDRCKVSVGSLKIECQFGLGK